MSQKISFGNFAGCLLVAGVMLAQAANAFVLTEVLNIISDAVPVEAYVTLTGKVPRRVNPLISEFSNIYNRQVALEPANGQLVLLAFSDNRRRVKAAFIDAKKKGGAVTEAWFKTEDIFDIESQGLEQYVPQYSCLKYRLDGTRRPFLYGIAGAGTSYDKMGVFRYGNDTFTVTLLPRTGPVFGKYQPTTRIGLLKERAPYSDSNYAKLAAEMLHERPYVPGSGWTNATNPLLVRSGNGGCAAFVTDFAKYIFDKNNFNRGQHFTNEAEIRSGDVIRLAGHYIAIVERNGDHLFVADGNCNKRTRQTHFAYSMANGKLRGGQFVCGWHYYDLGSKTTSGK